MMKILNLLFSLLFLTYNLHGAVIKGRIADYESGLPLTAKIDITPGLAYYANQGGAYVISDLQPGSYGINVSYPGYLPCADTIKIYHAGQFVELNFNLVLDTSQIKVPAEYHNIILDNDPMVEEYHKKYKSLSSWSVLNIRLDSIALKDKKLYAYTTFTNQLKIPLYILKNVPSAVYARGLVLKNGTDTMRVFRQTCGSGFPQRPEMKDLIVIPPGAQRTYPPIILSDNFEEYAPGSYTIIVKYSYRRPSVIPFSRGRKKDDFRDQIYLYNMALRRQYYSENSIVFENNISTKEPLNYKFLIEGQDSMKQKELPK